MDILSQFVDFVRAQPASRPLKHHDDEGNGSFAQCAVGHFRSELYKTRSLISIVIELSQCEQNIYGFPHIVKVVGNSGEDAPSTYGKLLERMISTGAVRMIDQKLEEELAAV